MRAALLRPLRARTCPVLPRVPEIRRVSIQPLAAAVQRAKAASTVDEKTEHLAAALEQAAAASESRDESLRTAANLLLGRTGPLGLADETGIAARAVLAAADEAFGPAGGDAAASRASVPSAVASRWLDPDGPREPLTAAAVAETCGAIRAARGKGAVSARVAEAAGLLRRCGSAAEAEFVCAVLLGGGPGAMRAGYGEKLVAQAVGRAVARLTGADESALPDGGAKRLADEAWRRYALRTDFRAVAGQVAALARGEVALPASPAVGVPVLPMLGVALRGERHAEERVAAWSDGTANASLDWKLDGERLMLHGGGGEPWRAFSRKGEDTTAKFAALVEGAEAALGDRIGATVLDGEAVVVEPVAAGDAAQRPRPIPGLQPSFRVKPFRHVSRMPRLGPADSASGDTGPGGHPTGDGDGGRGEETAPAPTCRIAYGAFDALMIDGESLVDCDYAERRARLAELLSDPRLGWPDLPVFAVPWSEAASGGGHEAGDGSGLATTIHAEVLRAAEHGAEGLMLKPMVSIPGRVSAAYVAGSKSTAWAKLKVDAVGRPGAVGGDTLDLVVVGAFEGKGRRAGGFGAFLVACAAGDGSGRLVPVARVGTGLSDELLSRTSRSLRAMLAEGTASEDEPPDWLSVPAGMTPAKQPSLWLTSQECAPVWEVQASEVTPSAMYEAAVGAIADEPCRGVSLRFPRLLRERSDKTAADASSERDVAALAGAAGE